MKFFVSAFLIAFLSFAAGLYFPWWSIAIVGFVVSVFIQQASWLSFLTGFLAIFLLWSVMAIVININNDEILAHRASLLIIKVDNPLLLVALTGLTGGVVAGIAALAGSFLRPVKVVEPGM